MKRFILGQLMGFIQLIFWIIMIPWIIITIPLHLLYSFSEITFPPFFVKIFDKTWIDWRIGVMIISTINITLLGGGMIWIGWQLMHPITEKSIKVSNIDRLKRVQTFSKTKFLSLLHREAQEFQNKRFR